MATGIDGSKRAENILRHVEQLAFCYHASVIFLQVLKLPTRTNQADPYTDLFQQQIDDRQSQAKTYLDGIKGKFREKNIASKSRFIFGSVVKEILRMAEQEKVDLIAICSHGRGGLSRLFYGSVASGILNRVDRPLLVVRSRKDE